MSFRYVCRRGFLSAPCEDCEVEWFQDVYNYSMLILNSIKNLQFKVAELQTCKLTSL